MQTRKFNSPQPFASILAKEPENSLIARVAEAKRVQDALARAIALPALRQAFKTKARLDLTESGVMIHTQNPTLASRLRQMVPTLESALKNTGIFLPIASVRADMISEARFDDAYEPLGAPRGPDPQAAEAISREAGLARDPDIKKALASMAKALER